MHASTTRPSRRFRRALAAATLAATFAVPSTATAATNYIVTLYPSSTTTCEQTIAAVTFDYSVTATHSYTSSFCGFSTSTSTRRAQKLAADPRVESVTVDGVTTLG